MPLLQGIISATRLSNDTLAWCLYGGIQRCFASVSSILSLLLFKHSGAVIQLGWSSPTVWFHIVSAGALFGTICSPIIGAAADQCSRRKSVLLALLLLFVILNFVFIATISFYPHVAVLAFIGVRVLFICSCSLHESLSVSFCDRNTVQHSFVAATVLYNALSCMMLLAIASVLRGQPPSVVFSCQVCVSLALISLALARVLRSHVSEPKTEESAEPAVYPSAVTALLNGARALEAQYEILKIAAANFVLQDGISCLLQITAVYSAYIGVSTADLILGDATSRLFGSISALLWMPFCKHFGIRASYIVSICMGVAACCVILFPMSPILFWFLLALVALSSTGTHICSRLLLSEHTVVKHASATFGFATGSSQMCGILCPALYALVSASSSSAHGGLLVVLAFMILGFVLMSLVDFSKHRVKDCSAAATELFVEPRYKSVKLG